MNDWKQRIRENLPVPRRRHWELSAALQSAIAETDALRGRIDRLETTVFDQRCRLGQLIDRAPTGTPPSLAPIDANYSMATCIGRLRELAPVACAEWERLLEVNARAYTGFPTESCSVGGHPMAERFRGFLRPYLTGAVLDVGCGPQPVPQYLADYPIEWIAGVDPLPAPHPFTFVQGTAEFLPWRDHTFDTVIVATSLDHVLLLDQTLREIRRVLTATGVFVTWVSFIPGAAAYNPYKDDVKPLDEFHLFHFDRGWFETAVGAEFNLFEVVDGPGSTFVSLRPKSK